MTDAEKRLRDQIAAALDGKGPTERVSIRLPAEPIDMSEPLVFKERCVSLYGGGPLRFAADGRYQTAVEFRDCWMPRYYYPHVVCALPVNVDWFAAVAFRSYAGGAGVMAPAVVEGRVEALAGPAQTGNYYGVYFVSQAVAGSPRRVEGPAVRGTEIVFGDGDARPLEFTGCNGGIASGVRISAPTRTRGHAWCLSVIGSVDVALTRCSVDIPATDPRQEFTGALRCGGIATEQDGRWSADAYARGCTARGAQTAWAATRWCDRLRLEACSWGTDRVQVAPDFSGVIEVVDA